MTDRVVSMIVQVGGAARNQYLRSLNTAEQYQKRLTGALQGTKKQLGAVAAARDYERRRIIRAQAGTTYRSGAGRLRSTSKPGIDIGDRLAAGGPVSVSITRQAVSGK